MNARATRGPGGRRPPTRRGRGRRVGRPGCPFSVAVPAALLLLVVLVLAVPR